MLNGRLLQSKNHYKVIKSPGIQPGPDLKGLQVKFLLNPISHGSLLRGYLVCRPASHNVALINLTAVHYL